MSSGGQKNIENVKAGDEVISESEAGKRSISIVADLQTPVSNNLCRINYADGGKLDLTKNHPLFTSLGWKAIDPVAAKMEIPEINVSRLQVGDMVKKSNDSFSTVASYSCKDENVQTYNLSLEGEDHTYFADDTLVHNKAGCFLPGTLVESPDGVNAIEKVKVGDSVTSFDDKTGEVKESVVTDLYKVYRDHYFSIVAGGYNVKVTAEHPFYIGDGEYKEAQYIKTGDILYVESNGGLVRTVVAENVRINEPTSAYNLTVDNTHTFFANGFAVHNKGVCDGCGYGPRQTKPVESMTIINNHTNPPSATISWTGGNGTCPGGGNGTSIFFGTDLETVNHNCRLVTIGSLAGYAPTYASSVCLPEIKLPVNATTFNTAGRVSLASNKVYYVKITTWYDFCSGGDEPECSSGYCGGPNYPLLMNCPVIPNPAEIGVGEVQTFSTFGNAATQAQYVAANTYSHPASVETIKVYGHMASNDFEGCTRKCQGTHFEPDGLQFYGRNYGSGTITLRIRKGSNTRNFVLAVQQGGYNGDNVYISNGTLRSAGFDPASIVLADVSIVGVSNPVANTKNINAVRYSKPAGENNYTFTSPINVLGIPYNVTVQGVLQTATNPAHVVSGVYATYFSAGPAACVDFSALTVNEGVPESPWWQVIDSDLQSSENISSSVPTGNYLGLPGSGGFPGVPASIGNNFGDGTASQTYNWQAQGAFGSPKTFKYADFVNLIPPGTVINTIDQIDSSVLSSGSIDTATGYYWYKYDGSQHSGQALAVTNVTDVADRKVIVLVENADTSIDQPINLTDGQGFFMLIVNGNINISSAVGGGGAPNLEGLYVADGVMQTGTSTPGADDNQLWIRGAVAAYGGITLSRDLGSGNIEPAELFEYAPDQIMLYPTVLGYRKIKWGEVAP